MSTGSTSNITSTFLAQAQSATEYAKNISTAVELATTSSRVVTFSATAAKYASTALLDTNVDSIYTAVSISYYYVAYAVTSAAASVALIQDSNYFTSYTRTIQVTYSEHHPNNSTAAPPWHHMQSMRCGRVPYQHAVLCMPQTHGWHATPAIFITW
ncbi:hypothetical protein ABBQ32_007184 [Trebouxia sp. C0010 RCD-2024]